MGLPAAADGANTSKEMWKRSVLDDQLAWGHAVWCANLDDDPDEELIIGVRDNKETHRRGVRIFDPELSSAENRGKQTPAMAASNGGATSSIPEA